LQVTCGANQAFVNIVLTLCDVGDRVGLFAPYYFNHKMCLQMTGLGPTIVTGERDAQMIPDAAWVERTLSETGLKMLVVCNPDNPTGTVVPKATLDRISEACARHGCWLVLDNTYEYFVYGGAEHYAIEATHVINIFSFSKARHSAPLHQPVASPKLVFVILSRDDLAGVRHGVPHGMVRLQAYGMMGWRVGYIAYVDEQPGEDGQLWSLEAQLLKAQVRPGATRGAELLK
jgi:aspartate/methionine/tyrosine aminotransferase